MARNGGIQVKHRAAKAVAVLVVVALLFAISGCVPGLRPALGLPAGYEYNLLRTGAMYTEARPGSWLIGSPRRKSSITFATDSDEIILMSQTTLERGRVSVTVRSGLWGGDEIYSESITTSGDHTARLEVPKAGIYGVTSNYVFAFRGRHELSWRVE